MGLNSKYKGAEIEALLDEVNAGVNVYYTSFTVEDIWQIYNEETYERIVLDAGLIQAINDKKVIVVPSRSGTPRQLIMLYDINPDYNTCQFRFVGAKGYFYMVPFDIVDFKVGYIIDFLSNAGWYDYANPEVAPIANTLVLRDDDSTIQIGRLKELSTNTTWVLPTYKGSGYDYRLQEHLVSGQNIRTINGISIVGSGNIPINSYDYYVLRNFSFNDLFDAVLHGEELSYGSGEIQDIIDAFERKIPVFIERDFDDGYKSLILVTGYAEDLLYLTINDGYEIINVECSRNGDVDYFFPTLISLSDLDAVKLNLKNVEDGLGILSEQYADTIEALGDKVDKVSGKGLSTNDYTTTEKNKLAGIAAGAEVNVQSDWNVTDSSSDAYIKNKPTIPSAVTESTVSSWGFTKNTGTYSKPSGGIPKSDLASAIQTSLGKADTALQSYTEQYKGTVTGVKVNGTTYSPSNGVVDLGTISGGGGGNSSVFITHFTPEEFASGYVEFTDEQVEAIRNAAKQNKIIALPSSTYGGRTGFTVASYEYSENEDSDLWTLYISVIWGVARYANSISSPNYSFGVPGLMVTPFLPKVEYVEVDEDGYALADSYNKDNVISWIVGECRYLHIGEVGPEYGMTVRFFTGEDCTIDYWGYWANGVIPTIEPYTVYEMSIVIGADGNPCAVLTPFKYVD